MTSEAGAFWERAVEGIEAARALVSLSFFDAAASRSYYAAFHAVSALLAREGKMFTKHSAVERAVHRDLVHSGRWDKGLGSEYTFLRSLRETGDYGGAQRVSKSAAERAVDAAERVITAVQSADPDAFPL